MDIKVLNTETCIMIDGIRYHHHPNGGGLVAEGLEVSEDFRVDLGNIISEESELLIQRFLTSLEKAEKAFRPSLVTTVRNQFRRSEDKLKWISDATEGIKTRGRWNCSGPRQIGQKSLDIIAWVLKDMQKKKPFFLRWRK